jgi:hypothetical protein
MKITNEVKAKVFAQYLYQKVLCTGTELVVLDKTWNWSHPSFKLILKPLSAISDEDAIKVVKIVEPMASEIHIAKDEIIFTFPYGDDICSSSIHLDYLPFNIGQLLQSKGYDLPNYHLDCKTLFECGLAIYE